MTTEETKTANELVAKRTSNELAGTRTVLAGRRSVMAADRTLMAWVRTALSMISFGFTIYKLLDGFQQSGVALGRLQSPRIMGLFLTGLGTVSMLMGTIEHAYMLRDFYQKKLLKIWRPAFLVALIMSATGLFLFVSIIRRAL